MNQIHQIDYVIDKVVSNIVEISFLQPIRILLDKLRPLGIS
jgi:hypothetical protein